MKAQELRIGNFVNYIEKIYEGQKDQVVKIIAITQNYLKDDTNKNTIVSEVEAYKPIPLTEERLLKFGAKEQIIDECGGKNRKDVKALFLKYQKGLNLMFIDGKMFYGSLEIKHVHQLQNLYFALTGEELTLN